MSEPPSSRTIKFESPSLKRKFSDKCTPIIPDKDSTHQSEYENSAQPYKYKKSKQTELDLMEWNEKNWKKEREGWQEERKEWEKERSDLIHEAESTQKQLVSAHASTQSAKINLRFTSVQLERTQERCEKDIKLKKSLEQQLTISKTLNGDLQGELYRGQRTIQTIRDIIHYNGETDQHNTSMYTPDDVSPRKRLAKAEEKIKQMEDCNRGSNRQVAQGLLDRMVLEDRVEILKAEVSEKERLVEEQRDAIAELKGEMSGASSGSEDDSTMSDLGCGSIET